jgi:hypothetical protein
MGWAVWADSCNGQSVTYVVDMLSKTDLGNLMAWQAKVILNSQWAAARFAAVQAERSTPST